MPSISPELWTSTATDVRGPTSGVLKIDDALLPIMAFVGKRIMN